MGHVDGLWHKESGRTTLLGKPIMLCGKRMDPRWDTYRPDQPPTCPTCITRSTRGAR